MFRYLNSFSPITIIIITSIITITIIYLFTRLKNEPIVYDNTEIILHPEEKFGKHNNSCTNQKKNSSKCDPKSCSHITVNHTKVENGKKIRKIFDYCMNKINSCEEINEIELPKNVNFSESEIKSHVCLNNLYNDNLCYFDRNENLCKTVKSCNDCHLNSDSVKKLKYDDFLKSPQTCCGLAIHNNLHCKYDFDNEMCYPELNKCSACNEANDGSDLGKKALKDCCKKKEECKLNSDSNLCYLGSA